jgi:hypothetical protein
MITMTVTSLIACRLIVMIKYTLSRVKLRFWGFLRGILRGFWF